jgi:glycerate dehydrogenase
MPAELRSVFLDFDTLGAGDIKTGSLTSILPGIELFPGSTPAEVSSRIAGCSVVIINKVRLDRAILGSAPDLRLVCLAATGTDNVDLQAARELGITVCNIRDYCAPSVVQHVFGLILSLTLRLNEYRKLLRAGGWGRSPHFCRLDFPTRELAGKTFGIVGYGNLGQAVAVVARAFGMRVVAAARDGTQRGDVSRLPLADLLAEADVLSLHCPLTPDNRHMIDGRALAAMHPDALLINTARGGLVDASALLGALRAGRIGGAGIDVLDAEPPADGNPLLDADLPNLLVTPHIAWAAREARQRALEQIAANVQAYQAGHPRNRVA